VPAIQVLVTGQACALDLLIVIYAQLCISHAFFENLLINQRTAHAEHAHNMLQVRSLDLKKYESTIFESPFPEKHLFLWLYTS
jgi:hypothetical protein